MAPPSQQDGSSDQAPPERQGAASEPFGETIHSPQGGMPVTAITPHPAAMSVTQLVDLLVKLSLLTPGEGRSLQQQAEAKQRSTPELLQDLVRLKRITPFQSEQLAAGAGPKLILGPYLLLDRLGAGGMGVVYKARHGRMGREIALKVLAQTMHQGVQRFLREVRVAAQLNHPNIVRALDAGQAGDVHFLEMELVDGRDLAEHVKEHGPLPCEKVVDYIMQAARGLGHAHAQGIIHRDIKPANLLLDRAGTVKILDMGLARFDSGVTEVSQDLTNTGHVMGTLTYMSPEQAINTKNVDLRTDVYSLGCTLYHLLTGNPPYRGESGLETLLFHREQPIPSLQAANPSVPDWLEQAYRRMLAKRPEQRYGSMSELIADLERGAAAGTAAGSQVAGQVAVAPRTTAEGDDKTTSGGNLPTAVDLGPVKPAPEPGLPMAAWGGIGGAALVGVLCLVFAFQPPAPKEPATDKPAADPRPSTPRPSTPTVADKSPPAVSDKLPVPPVQPDPLTKAPPTKAPQPLSEREIAQALLPKCQKLTLEIDGQQRANPTYMELPPEEFTVVGAVFSGKPMDQQTLELVGQLTNLTSLDLWNTGIVDDDLARLASLEKLIELKVGFNKLTDAGMAHVARLHNLRSLNLQQTDVTDKGLKVLGEDSVLNWLSLHSTQVSDGGIEGLSQFSRLKFLNVANTRVSAAGAQRLNQALPQCEIKR